MNYNNFSCRLVAPRLPAVVQSALPRKTAVKKERKPARRRLVAAASAVVMLLGMSLGSGAHARDMSFDASGLQWVPASGTVAFTGATGHLSLDISIEEATEEGDVSAQLETFSAQVNALAAKSFPSVHPAHAAQLSALTGVLLCAGLGVVIVRAGLLFRTDLVC